MTRQAAATRRRLARILDDLGALHVAANRRDPSDERDPLDRIHHDLVLLRASRTDGDRTSSGGHSDPTPAAALAEFRQRPADRDAAIIATQLDVIADAIAEIRTVIDAHGPRRQPTAVEQGDTSGCRSCERVRGCSAPRYSKSDRGVLDEPMPLCRFCWEWTPQLGQLPPRRMIRLHHAGYNTRTRGNEVIMDGEVVATLIEQDVVA